MKIGSAFLALTFAIVTVLCSSAIEPAFAAKSPKINAPKSFQAQFTRQVGGNPPQRGTMYYSHGRIREEIMPAGGPKLVTIIDPPRKMIFLLDAYKKAFRLLPWDARSALISEALKRSGKRKLVDVKTVDGQECQGFEIEPTQPGVNPFYLWVNKSTRFPVQLTSEDSDPAKQIQIKWTNLSPGYQAAILFDPPLGYQETK